MNHKREALYTLTNQKQKVELFSKSKTRISSGYERIVFGGRGDYIEIVGEDLDVKNIHIPHAQLYRLNDNRVYYTEFRTSDEALVKVYFQKKTVSYADYKVGFFYVSVNDIFLANQKSILHTPKQEFPPALGEYFIED